MISSSVNGNDRGFTDVPAGYWAYDTIQWAVERGIVDGYPDGTFKPRQAVREAEFLAMLFRAYPEVTIPERKQGASWEEPYFALARSYQWPVWRDGAGYDRGRVAQVVAASQGRLLPRDEAVQYLLDEGLSHGKYAPTVEGYGMDEPLTRAEAVQFIRNLKAAGVTLSVASAEAKRQVLVRGIGIGDSESYVLAELGEPARKDVSEYGFEWYIYNDDYANYAQIGIRDGRVVGLYASGEQWSVSDGVTRGTSRSRLQETYGEPLKRMRRGDTLYWIREEQQIEAPTYLIDQSYVTFFIDVYENDTAAAILVVEETVEQEKQGMYGEYNDAVRNGFEKQMLDLINAARARYGIAALQWDDAVAATARKHSVDMAERNFFDHVNPDGKDPFDRMSDAGIRYASAAENIAAGQVSAIFAHHALMNSPTGHRDNILWEDVTHAGMGVSLGKGQYSSYYTQKFIGK